MYSKRFAAVLGVIALAAPCITFAQENWFDRYERQALTTLEKQPQWATPLITTSPRIEQGLRADFTRQIAAGGVTTWNDGGTKGLQLIPFPRTELRLSPPPFLSHSDPRVADGFGDVAFRLKYLVYGSNEQHHDALASLVLAASYPTGKHTNGSCCAILTPTLELGKGFGALAMTATAGGTLPVSNVKGLGRSIVLNEAIEYRVVRLVTLDAEFSSTLYKGGRYDGKEQTFATPGVIVGRIPLWLLSNDPKTRLTLTLGAGEQIALTQFNTYNHAVALSGRLRF